VSATPADKRQLSFKSEDEVIADLERLRRGYVKAGNWSLPQAAWHLAIAVESRMRPGPFPPDSPEQLARKSALPGILASGKLPQGIQAPDAMTPQPDAPEDSIDRLIDALRRFKTYKGEIPPHRVFGAMPDADARQLNLIHCAHHLSHLVPTT
jgi:hypothetical protein